MSYSTSDKLAIALTCLAGAMAIILFLVEKTPAAVIGLLLLMLGLLVYPILHFAKRAGTRAVAFIACIIGTLLLGWLYAWPHNHSISANGKDQEPQRQAKPEEKKTDKKGEDKKPESKPKPKAEKPNPDISVGNITQGPCSNVQVGGSNNTATTNCASPSRVLSAVKAKQLTADFSRIPLGTIWVFQAGTSDDVQPVFLQFCNVMEDAGWYPNCQGLNGMSTIRTSIVEGIQCFSDSWNTGTQALVKTALDNAGFGCSYINHAFTSGNITLGPIAILIGTRPPS